MRNLLFWLLCFASQLPFFLQVSGGYFWHTLATVILATAILLYRWNRRPGLKLSALNLTLLIGSLGFSLLACLFSAPWLATFAIVTTAFAFSSCQIDSRENRLITLGFIAFPVMTFSTEISFFFQARLVQTIAFCSHSILRAIGIPHLVDGEVFRFISDQHVLQSDGIVTLRLFVLLAICYSILVRRTWMVLVANILSAASCFIFYEALHCVLVGAIPDQSSATLAILSACASVALFWTTERAFRIVFAPIADDATDSQRTNPLVYYWNYLGSTAKQKETRPASTPAVVTLAIAFLFALILQIFSRAEFHPKNHADTASIVAEKLHKSLSIDDF